MTYEQQYQFERALNRADERGVHVTGKGHTNDGHTIYTTTSGSEANRWHVVAIHENTLVCDCKASEHGRYCCHRSVVSVRIRQEREAAKVARESAPLHRSNAGFSKWK